MLPTLPNKYYLAHARELFGFVQNQCDHLLEPAHKNYLQSFAALSQDAQCLLVRCIARKPRYLKIASLSYAEIKDVQAALNELKQRDFLSHVKPKHSSELWSVLTKPQLLSALKESQLCVKSSTKKAELVSLASEYLDTKSLAFSSLAKHYIFRQQSQTLDYILFLFFGDLNNRFQKFAMRDLGVLKTRKASNKLVARFPNKPEALSAFTLQRQRRDFLLNKTEDRGEFANTLLATTAIGSSAGEIKDKLLLAVGNAYAKDKPHKAIQLWQSSNDPQATEKWIRERYKQDKQALKSELEHMRQTEQPATTEVFIEDFYARKYQGKRTSIYTDILRESSVKLAIDEAYIDDVEEGVIHYYSRDGAQAYFTENKVWRVVFALTFWKLLFGKAHVQHSEFDRLPALLRNGKFYETFKDDIQTRLEEFDHPEKLIHRFTKLITQHYGKPTGLFRWNSNLLSTVTPFVMHSPAGTIKAVLTRMAQDYRHTKDGYPDLMIIDDDGLRFEEVKSPGDVLRPNQLVSINRLRRAGFSVNVTQVDWATNPDQIYAVVDIETTGSQKGGNAITEIAVVKVRNQEIISEWSSLINPQRHIPAHITRLTSIDNAMVANAPLFSEIADELTAQLADNIFVAHNVGFDYGFIKAAYESIGQTFRHPKYCTVKNSRKAFPGLKSYSLGNLAEHFDIDLKGAHRALNDAKATAHLLRLIQESSS